MLRLLAATIACTSFVYAVDMQDSVRKTVPASSAIA